MAWNSIRDSLSKEDIIADIQLSLSADSNHSLMILVVEGSDDITFFNGKLHQNVELLESYSGKLGVIEIVNHFNDDRIVGICDKDYDECPHEKILCYDYSCLEMMLISSDAAFTSFCYTYYSGSLSPLDLRSTILCDLKILSVYRKLSSAEHWGVSFRGLSISKAFDPNKKKLSYVEVIKQLKQHNPGIVNYNHDHLCKVKKLCDNYPSSHESLFSITNGHDFLDYFQKICCLEDSHFKHGTDGIKKGLACSYRIEDFAKSELCELIEEYQNQHNVKILQWS